MSKKQKDKDLEKYGLEFLSPNWQPKTITHHTNKNSSKTITTVIKKG